MLHRIFTLALSFLMISAAAFAQDKTVKDSLPYQKYPKLPAFNLLLQDSATIFNTYNIPEGKPTLLVFFSPDCEHCELTIKALLGRLDSLKDVQLYLFTPMDLSMLKPFSAKLNLKAYKNIRVVGKDYQYFFPMFYGAKYVPYLVVYDRRKKFVKMWEGGAKMEELMKVLLAQ